MREPLIARKVSVTEGTGFSPYINQAEPRRALAPEGRFLGWNTKSPCPILSPFFWRKGGKPRLSTGPLLTCLAALTLLAGCKPVGPNYSRPGYDAPAAYKETGATTVVQPPPPPAGGSWQPASPSDGMLRGKWWEIYQDPQLNQLEERIAAENPTLRQALETYLVARDQVSAARAAFYPTLSAGVGAQREEISANGPSYSPGKSTTYSDFTLSGQASWEPDFWGRIRRTVEAARSNAQASAADQANIDLSLHAEMAADYFQLRGLDAEIALLNTTVTDLENQLDLTQRRLTGGIGTEADVAQARTQLETVRAQRIDVGVARAQYEHAIGTIANLKLSEFSIPFSPLVQFAQPPNLALPKVPVGVPSQLLERRPDIAAAERRAAAANAQIGIAVSAYYPNINLTGTGGFESIYFTLETQFRAYYQKAANKTGVTGELLLQQLETRLDNVCYRLGFAMSRRQSRQLVRHGHIQVNGRKVNIPSFQCKVGDEIAVREGSKKLVVLEESGNFASGQRAVQWLDINRENLSGKVLALPTRADVNLPVNEQLIVELYSK